MSKSSRHAARKKDRTEKKNQSSSSSNSDDDGKPQDFKLIGPVEVEEIDSVAPFPKFESKFPNLYRVQGSAGVFAYNDDADKVYSIHLNSKATRKVSEGDVKLTKTDDDHIEVDSGPVNPGQCVLLYRGFFRHKVHRTITDAPADPKATEAAKAFVAKSEAGLKDDAAAQASGSIADQLKAVLKVAEAVKGDVKVDWTGNESAEAQQQRSLEELVLKKCIEQNIPYVDINFPPLMESVGKKRWVKGMEWLRPEAMMKKVFPKAKTVPEPCLYDTIEPNDACQGKLGDCYFVSSMACLAEFPEKVKDMFRHPTRRLKDINAEKAVGARRVTLCPDGWWQVVIVDDCLVHLPGRGIAFARNRRNEAELWPCFIEKAFAKAMGACYDDINGGLGFEAMRTLTGCPGYKVNFYGSGSDKAATFRMLLGADRKDYLININCPSHGNKQYYKERGDDYSAEAHRSVGIPVSHAYSLIQVKEIACAASSAPVRLVQIRNPHGNSAEWTGDWNKKDDPLWAKHPEAKAACDPDDAKDCKWWMSWDDCWQWFSSVTLCHMQTDWHDYRVRIGLRKDNGPDLALDLTVDKATGFTMLLTNGHYQRNKCKTALTVARTTDGGRSFKAVGSTRGSAAGFDALTPSSHPQRKNTYEVAMELPLEPGAYRVFARVWGKKDDQTELPLSLGIIASTEAGKGWSAAFVQPSSRCEAFSESSSATFSKHLEVEGVEREFQYNPEVGCPVLRKGGKLR